MNWISALTKGPRQLSLPSHHVRTEGSWSSRKWALIKHSDTKSADTLILDLASRTMRNKLLLFKPPNSWYFCFSSMNKLEEYLALCVFYMGKSPRKAVTMFLEGKGYWSNMTTIVLLSLVSCESQKRWSYTKWMNIIMEYYRCRSRKVRYPWTMIPETS